jgi:F0F1-type ATP synthase assembly protein I
MLLRPDLQQEWVKSLGYFGVIIGELVGATAVGLGAGWLLWKKAGLPSWTVMVTASVGVAAAFYRINKLTRSED